MRKSIEELLTEAAQLVTTNARSAEKNSELKLALQTFISVPPAPTIELIKNEIDVRTLHRLEKFSLQIELAGLSERVTRYLRERGVMYVAEIYLLSFAGPGQVNRPNVLGELQAKMDLEKTIRPSTEGWQPPYWENPTFIPTLDSPLENYSGGPIWKPNEIPSWWSGSCIGEYLISRRSSDYMTGHHALKCDGRTSYTIGRMPMLQNALRKGNLHAAAIIPSDWKPPKAS